MNLVDVLKSRAESCSDKVAFFNLIDANKTTGVTYRELEIRARSIAALLQSLGLKRQRVLLMFPSGIEFIAAFWGCIFAEVTPVPVFTPKKRKEHWSRLDKIAIDCEALAILTSKNNEELIRGVQQDPGFAISSIKCIVTDQIGSDFASSWIQPNINQSTVAFLQYTSGSTGNPKGVIVTHKNLIHNQKMMAEAFSQTEKSIFVTWLPLYHDMGLIGNVLLNVYLGAECNIMTPASFLAQPYLWLKAISNHKGTSSFAPNFAYELCANRITDEQKSTLDLSAWKFALNGAEPIRADTLKRFVKAFSPCGFSSNGCYPGYGLAEATLFVTGGDKLAPPITKTVDSDELKKGVVAPAISVKSQSELVCSGKAWDGQLIKIVNPETYEEAKPNEVGEIWLQGDSVAQGYWNKEEETKLTFHAFIKNTHEGPFLRTGDQGFVDADNQLYITGRLKELIIIRGRNYYPQDIEYTVQEHPELKESSGAAFSINVDQHGEKLVVVQEVERTFLNSANYDDLFIKTREAISENHDIQLHAIVFIKPATLPKTSSGKIQRRKVRDSFINNQLVEVARMVWAPMELEEVSFPDDHYWNSVAKENLDDEIFYQFKKFIGKLLGVAESEINDGFTLGQYGMDSVSAVRLHYELGIPLESVLGDAVISEIGQVLKNEILLKLAGENNNNSNCSASEFNPNSLSYNQQSIHHLDQLSKGTGAYHIALPLQVKELDVEVFRKTLNSLLEKHESLRSFFSYKDGVLSQGVNNTFAVPYFTHDASESTIEQIEKEIKSSINQEIDLCTGSVFRVEHFKISNEKAILLFVFHHIAVDLFSIKILLDDLGSIYTAFLVGKDADSIKKPEKYKDYVQEQWLYLHSDRMERDWLYWKENLSGELPILSLPTLQPRGVRQSFNGGFLDIDISPETTKNLKDLSLRSGATLNVILLAVYQLVLSRFSNQKDICIGLPAAGRLRKKWEDVVGYFVNPVVVRYRLDHNHTFREHLECVKKTVLNTLKHQEYPFPLLVERLCKSHNPAISPIYQTMFALYPKRDIGELGAFIFSDKDARMHLGALEVESFPIDPSFSQMDISLFLIEKDDGIKGRIQFNKDLFSKSLVNSFAEHFVNSLNDCVKNEEVSLVDVKSYSIDEYDKIRKMWKPDRTEYSSRKFVHQLINDQLSGNAASTALIVDSERLSYAELLDRTSRLTNFLQKHEIGPECVVGICMDRSIDMVVSILAILNAGAAYLPIDPDYPDARIEYILTDANPDVVLSHSTWNPKLGMTRQKVLYVDQLSHEIGNCENTFIERKLHADNIAYIIYTSGSTGRPKGAANTHGAILNRLQWMQKEFELDTSDCVLQKTSFGFDVSVWEFLWPLMYGATLAMAKPGGHRDSHYLCNYINEVGVTTIHFVPSMLELFLDEATHIRPSYLKRVICSGEELKASLQKKFFNVFQNVLLSNLYGPTEAAIDVSSWQCNAKDQNTIIPIGKAISNISLYVLDENLNPLPIDVPGQLYIGGVGLARGYVANPLLTAQRFIPDPFSSEPGSRMYATGDLACFQVDGNLNYLGRADFQIKLRGFRIELGEIEASLEQHENIIQVVAKIHHEKESAILAVYCLVKDYAGFYPEELTRFLRKSLPEYMIPSFFIQVNAFPINANGKLDRKQLELPKGEINPINTYREPTTTNEILIAGVWREALKVERVGLTDSFFSLGGHSLNANKVIFQIKSLLSVDISVAALFESPVLIDFVRAVENKKTNIAHLPVDLASNIVANKLTHAQESIYYLTSLDGASAVYNIPSIHKIVGSLDIDALARCIKSLMIQHESLRTTFIPSDEGIVAKIAENVDSNLIHIDLRGLPETELEPRITQLIDEEVHTPFDLEKGPLFRSVLLQKSNSEFIFILNMHHIISDGWSVGLILRDLSSLYNGSSSDSGKDIAPVSYLAFSSWQRTLSDKNHYEYQLDYWKNQLRDQPPVLNLPTSKRRPSKRSYRGSTINIGLPKDIVKLLNEWSLKENSTLFMTLLAAFKVIMMRFSSEKDISVGIPVSNRTLPEVEEVVGLFLNTLVIRSKVDDELTFGEFLREVKQTTLNAYSNQDVPFELVVKHVSQGRNLSYTPLFQVMFNFQKEMQSKLDFELLSIEALPLNQKLAKFDLTFSLEEKHEEIKGYIEFNSDVYSRETIQELFSHYCNLLNTILVSGQAKIRTIDLLSPLEREKILVDWNNTKRVYPDTACLHELFLKQALSNPNSIAILYKDQSITYKELNEQSDRVAGWLISYGICPDDLVAICMDRSPELIIGLLGILKAGAGYLPIDVSYPQDRISFILQDAGVGLLIADTKSENLLRSTGCTVINFNALGKHSNFSTSIILPKSNSRQLAYVNYTSGTTGTPKGTEIEHRSVVRLLFGVDYINLDAKSRVLHASSISFDASTFEIWAALLHGGCCVLLADRLPTGDSFQRMIEDYRVNVMWITAPLFNSIIDEEAEKLCGVEQLIVGGDALSVPHIQQALKVLHGTRLINGYGPTESTTFTCCYPIPEVISEPEAISIPIGKPIGNTSVYILDNNLNPAAIGIPGELYIGGDGLARGYLNRPGLTANVFIPNPFSPEEGGRMYRTGEMARFLPDGKVEYVGRVDNQLKIRGFRIEPQEVVIALKNIECVNEAIVVPDIAKTGEKRLLAYVVVKENSGVSASSIETSLASVLPEYMMPESIMLLDKFPLSSTGKVDRNQLPKPLKVEQHLQGSIVPAATLTEEQLVSVWKDLLDIEHLSVTDNFFEIGGHSLILIRIVARIKKQFSVNISIESIFENPTIRKLAALIDLRDKDSGNIGNQFHKIETRPYYPQSFAQKRFWFLDSLEGGSSNYNVQGCWSYKGMLDHDLVTEAVEVMVKKHEILRTSFKSIDNEPMQIVHSAARVDVILHDLSQNSSDENSELVRLLIKDHADKCFDLSRCPIFNIQMIRLATRETLLLINIHHIITDGWSVELFIKEFCAVYQLLLNGNPPQILDSGFQYVDYTYWQNKWLESGAAQSQVAYWRRELASAIPLIELPTDRPRNSVQSFKGGFITFPFSDELSKKLVSLSKKYECTLFHLTLAAFNVLLSKYTGQSDISVGTPIANRELVEVDGMLGLFLNTVVLRNKIPQGMTFLSFLESVKQNALNSFSNKDVPFEQIVEEINPERSLSHSPLFQVMFTLLNHRNTNSINGVELDNIRIDRWISKFDLSLFIDNSEKGLEGSFEFSKDLFDESTIRRMVNNYVTLLSNIADDPLTAIEHLSILSSDEYETIVVEWNAHQSVVEARVCIQDLIRLQTNRSPNNTAVIFRDQSLTYSELHSRVNQLAYYLVSENVGPETRVGVCLNRSASMLVAMLAVLQAGGTYVPIDPNYPRERIQLILDDSSPKVLLTERSVVENHFANSVLKETQLFLLDENIHLLEKYPSTLCQHAASPENLAYVIYTSGSTGRPKGVAITHANAVAMLSWGLEKYTVDELEGTLASTSICFDLSVFEIFLPLICGGTVLLVENALELITMPNRELVTLVNTVPSAIDAILKVQNLPASVKVVNLAGEPLSRKLVDKIYEQKEVKKVYNLYGPSEDTTYSTWSLVSKKVSEKPLIGKPISNTQCYVLDKSLQPVPVGVSGELYIGGAGVSRGYLGRPDLTAERYIPSPFGPPGDRLYKTGDVVRYLPNAELDYIGRNDHQIKLRGFRIELGEIENCIASMPGVEEAVLKLHNAKNGEQLLIAYITGNDQVKLESSQLKIAVTSSLPPHMVPSRFIFLKQMPLTSNGKIDRKGLPEPDDMDESSAYFAPKTKTEKALADIWKSLLKKEVSLNGDFFALGGHSLLVVQLSVKINESFGLNISMKDIFQHPDLEGLSDFIDFSLWISESNNKDINVLSNYEDQVFETGEL